MKYKNASDILPPELLKILQKYASGELIYVPSGETRKKWGEGSGARQFYAARNEELRQFYFSGTDVDTLAEKYALSIDTIRKIVFK